jgi:hypothetical protein
MIMDKRNITMQIKEMAKFIMYILVEFVYGPMRGMNIHIYNYLKHNI